jgi:hypothetical protein
MAPLRSIWHRLVPRTVRTFLYTSRVFMDLLLFRTGHYRSSVRMACVDRQGNPLPWYTYPAIDYIKQLDFSEKTVFEYGAGNSTLFWASLARRVVSVEHNLSWYEYVKGRVQNQSNVSISYCERSSEYVNEIARHDKFDVIVVDGAYRAECAREAQTRLKSGGMIIFDNADRYVEAAGLLRTANFIEIDMFGIGPLVWEIACTSLFLDRAFNFAPKIHVQPQHRFDSPSVQNK